MAKWVDVSEALSTVQLQVQLAELKVALRYYADAERYTRDANGYDLSDIERDEGDTARAALRKIGAM